MSPSLSFVCVHAGDIPLKEKPELKDLVATSTKIASMDAWYNVGLQLGISEYKLATIQTNKSTCQCCREMFLSWLKGEQHTGNKLRTWETLLQAVAAVFGGGKDSLTERIRDSLRVHFCNRGEDSLVCMCTIDHISMCICVWGEGGARTNTLSPFHLSRNLPVVYDTLQCACIYVCMSIYRH